MQPALIILAAALTAPPDIDPPREVERPNVQTHDWDRARWVDYFGRKLDCDTFVSTGCGKVADVVQHDVAWIVAADSDWEKAVTEATQVGMGLEREPGVWLLCPGGRTEEYNECRSVVEYYRAHGIRFHVRSTAISEVGE